MSKLLLSILLIFGSTAVISAQADTNPRAEFFAGYSVLRTDYTIERPAFPQPVITAFFGKQTLNGLNVAATGYLTKGFGITGDFSAHFTKRSIPDPLGGTIDTHIRVINALAGPQYKFRRDKKVTPFVRALAGLARTRTRLTVSNSAFAAESISSSTDFALAVGGGLDVKVSKRIDLRVIQADYNPIFLSRGNELGFGKARANNVRFSFGIVFK